MRRVVIYGSQQSMPREISKRNNEFVGTAKDSARWVSHRWKWKPSPRKSRDAFFLMRPLWCTPGVKRFSYLKKKKETRKVFKSDNHSTWSAPEPGMGTFKPFSFFFLFKPFAGAVSHHSQGFRSMPQFRLTHSNKMTNGKYQTLLCKALMSTRKK